jgi:hypothetical protein
MQLSMQLSMCLLQCSWARSCAAALLLYCSLLYRVGMQKQNVQHMLFVMHDPCDATAPLYKRGTWGSPLAGVIFTAFHSVQVIGLK